MEYKDNQPFLTNALAFLKEHTQNSPKYTPNGVYMPDNSAFTAAAAKVLETSEKNKANAAKKETKASALTEANNADNYGIADSHGDLGLLAQQLDTVDPDASIYNYEKNNFALDRANSQLNKIREKAGLPPEEEKADDTGPEPTALEASVSKSPTPTWNYSPFSGMSTAGIKTSAEKSSEIAARAEANDWVNNYYIGDNGRLFTKTSQGKIAPVYDPYNSKLRSYTEAKKYLEEHPMEEPSTSTSTKSSTSSTTKNIDDSQLQLADPNHYSNKVDPSSNTWGTRQNLVESRLQEAFNTGDDYALSAEEKNTVSPNKLKADEIENSIIGTDPLDKNQRWGTMKLMRDHYAKNEAFSTNTMAKLGNDIQAITNDTMDKLSRNVSNIGSIKDTIYALSNGNASAQEVIANYYPKLDPMEDKALGIAALIEDGKRKHPNLSYAVIGTVLKKYLTNDSLPKAFISISDKVSEETLKSFSGKFSDALKVLDSKDRGNINDIKNSTYETIQKLQDLKSLKVAYDTANTDITNAINDQISFNKGDVAMSEFAQQILDAGKIKAYESSKALYDAAIPVFSTLDAYNETSKENTRTSEKK